MNKGRDAEEITDGEEEEEIEMQMEIALMMKDGSAARE